MLTSLSASFPYISTGDSFPLSYHAPRQPGCLLTLLSPMWSWVGVIQTKPENIKTKEYLVSIFPFSTSSGEKKNIYNDRTFKFFYYKSLYNEVPDIPIILVVIYIYISFVYRYTVFTYIKVKRLQTA